MAEFSRQRPGGIYEDCLRYLDLPAVKHRLPVAEIGQALFRDRGNRSEFDSDRFLNIQNFLIEADKSFGERFIAFIPGKFSPALLVKLRNYAVTTAGSVLATDSGIPVFCSENRGRYLAASLKAYMAAPMRPRVNMNSQTVGK